MEEHLIEYEESQEKLTRELEDCQEQQKDLEAQVSEFSKQADLICTKQSAMQAKREESMKKVIFQFVIVEEMRQWLKKRMKVV